MAMPEQDLTPRGPRVASPARQPLPGRAGWGRQGSDPDDEEDGEDRDRDPDVTWRREDDSRSVVEEPVPDEVDVPFGEA